MCGIVGLFLKDRTLQPQLGGMLTDMLVTMSDRGPDSAGIAIYSEATDTLGKLTVQSDTPSQDFATLTRAVSDAIGADVGMAVNDSHAVLDMPVKKLEEARAFLANAFPALRVMSTGAAVEIYKEVGLPGDVARRFSIPFMSGSHGIGHTRMATESAVTTDGAHPYNTGPDQCLVHNGSLSNHNALRRKLTREGVRIESDNDTEVGAAYLTWRMREGATLGEALESGIEDLDGFYTFVVGTRDGFGVLRDPIACKPAVLAETDRYVAFGSEYRALASLPGVEDAQVWEPEPATVYFWSH